MEQIDVQGFPEHFIGTNYLGRLGEDNFLIFFIAESISIYLYLLTLMSFYLLPCVLFQTYKSHDKLICAY
jgi:hypothetical protein